MSPINIAIISLSAFALSIFTVSVGGISLITVPLLIWLGMASKNAIATNMFALIFLSASGAIGFRKQIKLRNKKIIVFFLALTVCGAFLGANLVLFADEGILKKFIAIMVCTIVAFLFLKKDLGMHEKIEKVSRIKFISGALLIFALGIYGGFFSGGYITFANYILILIFGFNFLQVAFLTKIFKMLSSLVAFVFLYRHGLVYFPVAVPMALSMALGAFLGAKLAIAKGNLWIRNLFIIASLLLAGKLLFF